MSWDRWFPERIFSRRLGAAAEKRLRLAQARAEEAIVRAHVENALAFVDALAEDLPFDRAIESYVRVLAIPEPLASTVVTRTLVALGDDLKAEHAAVGELLESAGEGESPRPPLRLDDASDARVRSVRRA